MLMERVLWPARLRRLLSTLGVGLILGASVPPSASAAEIKVFSLPGMMTTFEELQPRFENLTGHKLAIAFLVTGPLMRRIDTGDKFDVLITGISDVDVLIRRNKIVADSRLVLARTGIGVWLRPGEPKPDIGTVEAFRRTMMQAKSISYTKESATGIYMARLMERLGIAEEMKPKTKLLGGGGQNPRAVAAGEVQYGISITTDGIGLPGVELLGLLPEEIQRWSIFVGGIAVDADDPAAARTFLKFLASPENASILKAKGWERVEQK
jgi:molybdate transport system substrate-binding protein